MTDGGRRLIVRHFHKRWKCIWPLLQAPKELPKNQPGRAGRRAGEWLLLSRHFALETQLGAAKHQTFCDQQVTLSILCLNCCFSSSRPPPFTTQKCYLKAVTLTFSSMYSSSISFPIWAAQGPQMRSQPLSTRCYTKLEIKSHRPKSTRLARKNKWYYSSPKRHREW